MSTKKKRIYARSIAWVILIQLMLLLLKVSPEAPELTRTLSWWIITLPITISATFFILFFLLVWLILLMEVMVKWEEDDNDNDLTPPSIHY